MTRLRGPIGGLGGRAGRVRRAEADYQQLEAQLLRAPAAQREALAEALGVAPRELARAVPRLGRRAEELAEQHMAKGREAIIGEGKLLNADMAGCSDAVLREKVREMFERYLQKMLSRATGLSRKGATGSQRSLESRRVMLE